MYLAIFGYGCIFTILFFEMLEVLEMFIWDVIILLEVVNHDHIKGWLLFCLFTMLGFSL